MGKTDVVRALRPTLKQLGFVYRSNMFQLTETKDQHLQLSISIQRNLHSDTYLIHSSILIRSPFVHGARQEAIVDGKLRNDGVYLHVVDGSWWPPESLPRAVEALKRFVLPWFRVWGSAAFLAERVEAAIREHKHLIDVFEPLTEREEELIARKWPRPVDNNWQVPARVFFYSSILHYLAGDHETAIRRTKDWLARLGPDDTEERNQAEVQLTSLQRAN